jgi:hypothetical protein
MRWDLTVEEPADNRDFRPGNKCEGLFMDCAPFPLGMIQSFEPLVKGILQLVEGDNDIDDTRVLSRAGIQVIRAQKLVFLIGCVIS